jgi:gluconate:H+ symporter, GntP family
MMGRILEVSGAAEQIAYSCIKWLGKRREEWAMAITGYVISIPIFADSAFVILYPVAKALAGRGQRSVLSLGVALAGGLVITHSTVPPTPGPLGVAGLFGVDIGNMLLLGLALGIVCVIGVVWYARRLEKQYPGFTNAEPATEDRETIQAGYLPGKSGKPLPGLMQSLLPILVPILLIFIKTTLSALSSAPGPEERMIVQVFSFIGTPIIALAISVLLAVYTLVPHLDRRATAARLEEGLQSAGIILMVTGAGGALGAVVRDSGTGNQLAGQIAALPISPVMLPFVVATLVRLIQGSGTVAMITAASITAPILAQIPGVNMLLAAQAATTGSLFFSYFNDSLYWVVNRMMGIVDVKQQMTVWSVSTTVPWAIGGTSVALLNLVFSRDGTLLDPLLPLLVLGIMLLVIRRKPVYRTTEENAG